MYKEPAKWAMPFQTYVTLTMLQTHTAHTDKRVKLMERSLFSARYLCIVYSFDYQCHVIIELIILHFCNRNCFVECMVSNGTLHKGMYNIMQEWYDYINKNIHIQADLIGKLAFTTS